MLRIKKTNSVQRKMVREGQSAIEYMLLLAVVTAIVLVGFGKYFPRVGNATNEYFNRIGLGIQGSGPRCGDGTCDAPFENARLCCMDCGFGFCTGLNGTTY